ncbi:MAG TPA: glutamyl-tRNA reductase [Candidatus Acidoferrales bacterium]|nr:glutamyl-tRNA reductase [Candidatus Acidoferrales bacterium]
MVGTNHKRAPIGVRERFWCPPEKLPERLRATINQANIGEAVILSTCNRTEVYAVSPLGRDVSRDIKKTMSEWSGIQPADIEQYTYAVTGEDAIHHLISVASGLDSLAVGEQQIQEQVKQASRIANQTQTSGPFLSQLFRHAYKAANSIRKQSGLDKERVSVSSAVTLMLKELSRKQPIQTILLVGAGKMISLAAEDLSVFPRIEVWVANRTIQRAQDLAAQVSGKAIGLEDIPNALEKADVVLTCISATDYVIGAEELQKAMAKRKGKELTIIDVGVPRNVNPTSNIIAGLHVYNIDDLEPFIEDQKKLYQAKIAHAEWLAREQVQEFDSRMRAYEVDETLKGLREVAEGIREKELSRALGKLGDIPSREKTIVDLLTRRIVNKLLYEPTVRLREHASNGDGGNLEAMIRELFGIGRQSEE